MVLETTFAAWFSWLQRPSFGAHAQYADLAFNPVAPRPEADITPGAANTPVDQVRFDGSAIYTYYEHSGAPASSGRALSRSLERLDEAVVPTPMLANACG